MKKQYENNIRKGGIAEEIAILKQRREARKAKKEKKSVLSSFLWQRYTLIKYKCLFLQRYLRKTR